MSALADGRGHVKALVGARSCPRPCKRPTRRQPQSAKSVPRSATLSGTPPGFAPLSARLIFLTSVSIYKRSSKCSRASRRWLVELWRLDAKNIALSSTSREIVKRLGKIQGSR